MQSHELKLKFSDTDQKNIDEIYKLAKEAVIKKDSKIFKKINELEKKLELNNFSTDEKTRVREKIRRFIELAFYYTNKNYYNDAFILEVFFNKMIIYFKLFFNLIYVILLMLSEF